MNKKIHIHKLIDFCTQVLEKHGMSSDDASVTAKVLATTDALGTHSHGTKNLYDYIRKVKAGGMFVDSKIEVIKDGPAFALLDAHACFGMVSGHTGMDMAIQKARESGISCVVVRNSSHFGAAGYYALMASQQNMIGLAFSNVDANMSVPGSRGKVIGNNPMAYSVPTDKNDPMFLDIALSSVASLKVIQARKDGKQIPDTWIIDKDGLPTTDPSNYPDEGAMQPMAAHKGYGLSLLVELLTGALGGGHVMREVPSWLFVMPEFNNVAHIFIAIDPEKFVGADAYKNRVDNMIDMLHESPKAKGSEHIFYPGEIEWKKFRNSEQGGIELPDAVADSLLKLAAENDMAIDLI